MVLCCWMFPVWISVFWVGGAAFKLHVEQAVCFNSSKSHNLILEIIKESLNVKKEICGKMPLRCKVESTPLFRHQIKIWMLSAPPSHRNSPVTTAHLLFLNWHIVGSRYKGTAGLHNLIPDCYSKNERLVNNQEPHDRKGSNMSLLNFQT